MKKYIILVFFLLITLFVYSSFKEGRDLYQEMNQGNISIVSGDSLIYSVSGKSIFKMTLATYLSSNISLEVISSNSKNYNFLLFRDVFVKSKFPYLMGYVPAWRKFGVFVGSGDRMFGLQTGFDLENIGTIPSKNSIFLPCGLMNYLFFDVRHSDGDVFFVLDGFSGTIKFLIQPIQKGIMQESIVSLLGQDCPL